MTERNIYTYGENGVTYYAVCMWDLAHNQYTAPLDADTRRLSGCHTEFARTPKGIGGYANLQKARRRARQLYGYSCSA